MTSEPVLGWAILGIVALHRVVEVFVDAGNTRRLLAQGGTLVRDDGFGAMVTFHVLWFAGLLAERVVLGARIPAANLALPLVGALLVVEALRVWVLGTLGRRFTVRVVVVPGERPVTRGPYRFTRHPNYLVVVAEVLLVPLLLGCWRTALVGSLAARCRCSWRRIRREEAAWARLAPARP